MFTKACIQVSSDTQLEVGEIVKKDTSEEKNQPEGTVGEENSEEESHGVKRTREMEVRKENSGDGKTATKAVIGEWNLVKCPKRWRPIMPESMGLKEYNQTKYEAQNQGVKNVRDSWKSINDHINLESERANFVPGPKLDSRSFGKDITNIPQGRKKEAQTRSKGSEQMKLLTRPQTKTLVLCNPLIHLMLSWRKGKTDPMTPTCYKIQRWGTTCRTKHDDYRRSTGRS